MAGLDRWRWINFWTKIPSNKLSGSNYYYQRQPSEEILNTNEISILIYVNLVVATSANRVCTEIKKLYLRQKNDFIRASDQQKRAGLHMYQVMSQI